MNKFSFTVEIVTDQPATVTPSEVATLIRQTIDGIGNYHAVKFNSNDELTEQGLKVWAKRCGGFSLAKPVAVKVPKVKVEVQEPATVGA